MKNIKTSSNLRVVMISLATVLSLVTIFVINYRGANFDPKPAEAAKPSTIHATDGTWCKDGDLNNKNVYKKASFCQDNTGEYQDYCEAGVSWDYYCGSVWDGEQYINTKCIKGGYDCTSSGLVCRTDHCAKK